MHPAPAAAVVALSLVLAALLRGQDATPAPILDVVLITLSVLGSQVLTGALNDWADRARDAAAQPGKPIPAGRVTPRAALGLAAAGALLQVATSIPLGAVPVALGAVASLSAVAYNLWLSRLPLSVLPYLVSFGVLPLWVASGVGAPLERMAAAPFIVGPFAAAAHLANTLRDFEVDARSGSRSLAQVLGARLAFAIAWVLAVGVGAVAAVVIGPGAPPIAIGLGVVGLVAVVQGVAGPQRLWAGMLVAAVAWTAAWALATG